MKGVVSRRSLLAGMSAAAVGTAAGQMLLAVARAQEAAPGAAPAGLCMTMLFMEGPNSKLDNSKYAKKHLPLLTRVYGDSVERIEFRTAAGMAMGVPSPIKASSTLWIRDVASFSQKLGANATQINEDLDGMSKGNRMVQVDRVALALGDARADVPQNSHVFSMFYPAASLGGMRGPVRMGGGPGMGGPGGPGAPAAGSAPAAPPAPTFDATYFTDVYLPKLFSLYGSAAVRRLEATVGMDQGGQPAAHKGAYHLLIRDRGAYDTAAQRAQGEILMDAGKFTTIFPIIADMRVTAIA